MPDKLTKGPWKAEWVGTFDGPDGPGTGPDCYEVTNGYQRVAESLLPCDARLIAAAPDLLEQMRLVVATLENSMIVNAPLLAVLDNARWAIRNAGG